MPERHRIPPVIDYDDQPGGRHRTKAGPNEMTAVWVAVLLASIFFWTAVALVVCSL